HGDMEGAGADRGKTPALYAIWFRIRATEEELPAAQAQPATWSQLGEQALAKACSCTDGQRVGVGFLGGYCTVCEDCRRGDFTRCRQQPIVGVHLDGGYAEVMLAHIHR